MAYSTSSAASSFSCLNIDKTALHLFSHIDYNLCSASNGTRPFEWDKGAGTSPTPLDAWRAFAKAAGASSSSFGAHSHYGAPQFTDADQADLRAASPASAMVRGNDSGQTVL